MMKKLLLLATLTLSLNSHALMIVDTFNPSSKFAFSNIGCLILLPVCILDEETNGVTLDRDYLKENLYTDAEIDVILSNQKDMLDIAHKDNVKVVVGQDDTKESLTNDLYTMNPGADEVYIDFVISNSGL